MKISKIHLGAVAFVASALFVFFALLVQVADAAEISQHDRQDMALQKAIQLCQAKGGIASWTMSERFRLANDPQGYRVIGNELLIVCRIPQAATPPKWLLTWARPTTRADGTALAVNQIAGYEVLLSDQLLAFVPGLEYRAEGVRRGDPVAVRTVDTDNRRSVAAPVVWQ